MDRWLEAYALWPATSQMLFSVIVVLSTLALALMVGIWTIRFSHCWSVLRKLSTIAQQQRAGPLKATDGYDWKKMQEEVKHEMEYQAKLQAEMEKHGMASIGNGVPTILPPEFGVPATTLADLVGDPISQDELRAMAGKAKGRPRLEPADKT